MLQSTCPREDRSNRIGRCLFTLLMFPSVSGHCTMGSFRFYSFPIRSLQHAGHEPKGAISLSHNVTLHIPIVVFASPYKASFRFYNLSNHIINETMFIPYFLSFKLLFIVSFLYFVENVFKSSILNLHYCVFSAHIERLVTF